VNFPFDIHTDEAVYEIQYGHVHRPTHRNTSWDSARFEVCGHKWVDVSEHGYGVALLNDCKYGFATNGSTVELTILKRPTYPNPDADEGRHIFTYSLLPHAGDFREEGVIQEAYSLNQGEGRDYGKEAVQTLIAEMENHRDDFCVIMAGYKDEMMQLLEVNPGLESRIPYVIDFPNYGREELEQIFFSMVNGNLAYEEGLKETVHNFFQSIPDEIMEDKTFSNARLVRNLFERAWGKAAYRRNLSGQQEFVILREDLISATEEDEFKKLLENFNKKFTYFGNFCLKYQ